jgi:hypothetical protein
VILSDIPDDNPARCHTLLTTWLPTAHAFCTLPAPPSWHQRTHGGGRPWRIWPAAERIGQQLMPMVTAYRAHPRLMALLLGRLADARDTLQKERNAWSFVWSGPDPLHAKTADTFATVDEGLFLAIDRAMQP